MRPSIPWLADTATVVLPLHPARQWSRNAERQFFRNSSDNVVAPNHPRQACRELGASAGRPSCLLPEACLGSAKSVLRNSSPGPTHWPHAGPPTARPRAPCAGRHMKSHASLINGEVRPNLASKSFLLTTSGARSTRIRRMSRARLPKVRGTPSFSRRPCPWG